MDYDLDYIYNDIKTYESTINSIGYVVAQYSMGYDFKHLNFIHFGDPKLSLKDIIQSIGRGLRPDCLDNGKNLLKELFISLPIFLDNTGKYENIVEVIINILM
jgi:predicted helicase